jgi:hypothetical protein
MARGVPNNTIHGGVWGDPDFQVLARALGLDRPADAIGRFAHLEHWCLSKATTVVTTRMTDLIMGDGGAEALVALGMASEVEGGIELGGRTAEKVQQWAGVRDRARAGGHARHEQAQQSGARSPSGRFSSEGDNHSSRSPADDQQDIQPEASRPTSPSQHSSSSSASPSPSASLRPEAEENPPLPPKGGRARKGGKGQPTPEEREVGMRVLAAITERTGVAYQGSDHHLRLIAGRLREGVSYRDLRSVVAYCWAKSGLNWREKLDGQGNPMAVNLKPETLFGPEGIHRYLDPARHWFETVARPAMTPEQLAELGESAAPRAPPAQADQPANVVTLQLRRAP